MGRILPWQFTTLLATGERIICKEPVIFTGNHRRGAPLRLCGKHRQRRHPGGDLYAAGIKGPGSQYVHHGIYRQFGDGDPGGQADHKARISCGEQHTLSSLWEESRMKKIVIFAGTTRRTALSEILQMPESRIPYAWQRNMVRS